MKKEVLFAVILGLILGGVLLFGIQLAEKSSQQANSATSSKQEPTPSIDEVSPSITPSIVPTKGLTITAPLNHSLAFKTPLKITGTATPGSTVIITSEEDERIATVSDSGTFTTDFNLIGGDNLITLTQVFQGVSTTATVSVIYTTAKLDD